MRIEIFDGSSAATLTPTVARRKIKNFTVKHQNYGTWTEPFFCASKM
jgi:hypothetical protein